MPTLKEQPNQVEAGAVGDLKLNEQQSANGRTESENKPKKRMHQNNKLENSGQHHLERQNSSRLLKSDVDEMAENYRHIAAMAQARLNSKYTPDIRRINRTKK